MALILPLNIFDAIAGTIMNEINAMQGKFVEIDGYYKADDQLVSQQMRPSKTFNTILSEI